jgi:HK97 family phage major capsid protein
MEDVKSIQAEKKAAEEADNLIKSMTTPETKPAEKEPEKAAFKTIGEYVANEFKKANINVKEKFDKSVNYKAAAVMDIPSAVSGATTQYEKEIIEGYRRELLIADLFSTEQISGNAVTFYPESSTVEGGPDVVAEGAKKPMMSFGDPTAKTVSLSKIASYMKETEELVEDTPWLATAINGRGMYEHQLKVEDFLVAQLMGTSGVQTQTGLGADEIFKAATAVKTQTKLPADAVVINPADYQTLRLAKDENGQYYGGGYFYGQYGNGGIIEQPSIWGLRTVVSAAVPAGEAIVGAFRLGAEVLKKGGVTVDIANQNEDDFIKNLITILIEERIALAVRRPDAFVILSADSES